MPSSLNINSTPREINSHRAIYGMSNLFIFSLFTIQLISRWKAASESREASFQELYLFQNHTLKRRTPVTGIRGRIARF